MSKELTEKQAKDLAVPEQQWEMDERDVKDIKFPRAKLFQGTTSEQDKFPDAKTGTVINDLTGELLPDTFVPFMKFRQYAKFNTRNREDPNFDKAYEPSALIWFTTDPNDPRVAETKWGPNSERPTAVEFLNFMAVFEGYEYPVSISFSKTSMTAGKKLLSMLMFSKDKFKKYKLSTNKQVKDGNTFYIYDVNPAGVASEEEIERANKFKDQMAVKDVTAEFTD